MRFEDITFMYKGATYKVNDEHCNKCKADCGRNYCAKNCPHVEEVESIEWICPNCGAGNHDKVSTLRDECASCSDCDSAFEIEIDNSGNIESFTEC